MFAATSHCPRVLLRFSWVALRVFALPPLAKALAQVVAALSSLLVVDSKPFPSAALPFWHA